jgi:hypothetical protein
MLGEFSDIALCDAQDFCHLRKGAFGLEGRETAHHGAMFPTVFFKNQFHYVVFEIVGEINVNVGQFVKGHPLLVEKTPEIKVEPNRADTADPKAIADEAVGGAAARNPLNAACPAVLKKVPGD